MMANGTAAADSSSSSSSLPPSDATSSPKTGRKPRGGAGAAASPWSSIVRGEPDPAASPSPPPSAATAAAAGTIPTAEAPVGTDDTAPIVRSESSDEAGINGGNAVALPSKGEKKSAWNVPQNGAVEGRPVMGAVLWPALSESTKASPMSSSSDLLAVASDGSQSVPPQELVSPTPVSKPSGSNSNLNSHGPPMKQKPMKRGGKSSSSGSLANGGPAPPSPTAPGETPQTASTRASSEPELSPREHNKNNGGNWDHAPSPRTGAFSPVGHGRNEHHRSYGGGGGHRRNNNASGTNHNNFGSRRDQDRGSNEWNAHPNFRGRDVQLPQQHQQRPPQRPFIRGPIPGPPPFVNPPSPVRAFVNPLGFPDMHPQMYYIPTPPPPPEVFRPMPYVAAPPIFIPHANPQLAFAVLKQIEFYFSPENLCKDLYLRQNMDGEGWVPISLVASFNRVRHLTGDINFVLESVCTSSVLEVQGDRIRRRGDWMNWILRSAGPTMSSLHSSDTSDNLTTRMRNIDLEGTRTAVTSSSFSGESSSHS